MADTEPTLPSLRELELEQLLRENEQQLADVTFEVESLRKQLSEAPKDETSSQEPVSAAAMAILLPHIVNERNALMGTGPSFGTPHAGLVAALKQRTSMLQEENDELYGILRRAETGRLDEEVKTLRVLVKKLETALRESDAKAKYLSEEMEKTTELLERKVTLSASKAEDSAMAPSHHNSKGNQHRHGSPHSSTVSKSSHVQPPSGPRHKKPRTHASPEPVPAPKNARNDSNTTVRQESYSNDRSRDSQRDRQRERSRPNDARESDRERPHYGSSGRSSAMDLDRRDSDRVAPHPQQRDWDRGSRERNHERDRERRGMPAQSRGDQDSNRGSGLQIRGSARQRNEQGRSPRNGPNSPRSGNEGQNGRPNGLPSRPDATQRGLAERMGL